MHKETFYGIKKLLEKSQSGPNVPVILIIKNTKTFNHLVLNDLIHLIKKYRSEERCNFSLMLGV